MHQSAANQVREATSELQTVEGLKQRVDGCLKTLAALKVPILMQETPAVPSVALKNCSRRVTALLGKRKRDLKKRSNKSNCDLGEPAKFTFAPDVARADPQSVSMGGL
jgi:hypothetical protein